MRWATGISKNIALFADKLYAFGNGHMRRWKYEKTQEIPMDLCGGGIFISAFFDGAE
jgi:hypothetical protein